MGRYHFWVCLFNDTVNWHYYTASVTDEWMSMEHWWNDTDWGKLEYWEYSSLMMATAIQPASRQKNWAWRWVSVIVLSHGTHLQWRRPSANVTSLPGRKTLHVTWQYALVSNPRRPPTKFPRAPGRHPVIGSTVPSYDHIKAPNQHGKAVRASTIPFQF
jgi:hypothetical protein